jgi:LmbE family N-acetylglucosaminyl deacetylase
MFHAHHDDHSWFWSFGSLAAKMIDAGYKGYYVRVSNDEKDGSESYPQNDLRNLRECQAAMDRLGIERVFSLNWRNDYMDPTPIREIRAQMILLIRKYRPDVVMTYDPWGHYDRNPDHRKVARAFGEAYWMAGYANVHPEHLTAGLRPHRAPYVYLTHRFDYGKGHEPNVAIELTESQVQRRAEGLWAHRNIYFHPGRARAIREALRERRLHVAEMDALSDAEAVEFIEKDSIYWSSRQFGARANVSYADSFFSIREWDHLPGLNVYLQEQALTR